MNRRLIAALLAVGSIAFVGNIVPMTEAQAQTRQPTNDSEMLGKAIDYFQSGKFHEALLLFDKLDKHYKLNPRFRAFLAVCHYYDWNDEKTCEYLDSLIPQLEPFAPHERSIYYYINAESHFNLGQYEKAIGYYEQMVNVCYNNEKSDAFYRLGYCHLFNNDTTTAYDYFNSALAYYRQFRNLETDKPRMAQIEKMIKGLSADKQVLQEEQLVVRDTIKGRIINDINLSDIYEHQMFIEMEDNP